MHGVVCVVSKWYICRVCVVISSMCGKYAWKFVWNMCAVCGECVVCICIICGMYGIYMVMIGAHEVCVCGICVISVC